MPLIRCPSCKTVFSASDAARGAAMACPSCAQLCRIPVKSATPKPPQPRPPVSLSPSPTTHLPEDDRLEEVDELEEVEEVPEVEEVDDADDSPAPRRRRRDSEGLADEPDDDESVSLEVVRRGGKRKKRLGRSRRDGNLDRVNLGLGFYYASILALLAGFVVQLGAFAALLTAGVAGRGAGDSLGLAFLLAGLAEILINWVAPLLGLIGSVLCLWAPSDAGARGLSLASVALNATAWLAGVLCRVLMFLIPEAAAIGALGMIPTFLITFIAWCLFMAFLRQLCTHLGEETLGSEAIAVMFRGIFILVMTPIAFLFGMILIRGLGCTGAMIFFACMLFGLYGIFLFLRRQLDLIGSIRQVIASRF